MTMDWQQELQHAIDRMNNPAEALQIAIESILQSYSETTGTPPDTTLHIASEILRSKLDGE